MAWAWVRWIRICIPRYHSVLTPTKRVITVAPMPPEKSAYALARYSRSPDSIRESIEWVRTHNSEKFLESFYFQYGHASIADLGHTVMCFEGISELAATEIEDEPLWDGQAKSSRYQDFSRSGFITPPELTGERAVEYQAAGEALLAAYAKVKDLAFATLCERLPRPEDMKPDAYQRNIAARAFDVARYLLFWGVPTNVGQVTSIRTLEKQIRRLKASEYEELRSLGDEIAQACAALPDCVWDANAKPEPLAPTLARHADADQHVAQSREDLKLWAAQNLPARAGRRPSRVDLIRPTNVPADIVATLLYSGHRPPVPRTIRNGACRGATAARRSDRRGAAVAHPARRDPRRVSRRPLRLRHRDGYRRLPRSAPPPPLPEIPAGLQRQPGLRHAGAGHRIRRRGNLPCRDASRARRDARVCRTAPANTCCHSARARASCSRWISPRRNTSRACAAA